MADYCLYHFPGSCSRVALNALEEIGLPYREQGVALMRGEHHEAAFRSLNPKAKVPVLVADGVTLTELPVILYHLANAHPAAHLLPAGSDGRATLASLSDVTWLAGTLHPLGGRVFRPATLSQADPEGVKAVAMALLNEHAAAISTRLAETGWWYGEAWSIADMFIQWVYGIAARCGFNLAAFETLAVHSQRVQARPSFIRAQEREEHATRRDGLQLVTFPIATSPG